MTGPVLDWARVVALVAHELRTPAGVVSGYLRMLQQGSAGSLPDAQRKLVDAADRSSTRLAALIDEISDLTRLETGESALERRPIALADLLAGLPEAASTASPTSSLAFVAVGEVPDVTLDAEPTALRRALASLARGSHREDEAAVSVAVQTWIDPGLDGMDVWLAIGAPESIRAFDPSGRGRCLPFDCWRGGHGLALVLAVRCVLLHEGEVLSVAHRPGQVVTLVRLPSASTRAA